MRQVRPAVRLSVLSLQTGGVTGTATTTVGTSPSLQHTPTVSVRVPGSLRLTLVLVIFLSTEKCYFLCEEKNLQELTCLSGKWSLDITLNSQKLACKMKYEEIFAK